MSTKYSPRSHACLSTIKNSPRSGQAHPHQQSPQRSLLHLTPQRSLIPILSHGDPPVGTKALPLSEPPPKKDLAILHSSHSSVSLDLYGNLRNRQLSRSLYNGPTISGIKDSAMSRANQHLCRRIIID